MNRVIFLLIIFLQQLIGQVSLPDSLLESEKKGYILSKDWDCLIENEHSASYRFKFKALVKEKHINVFENWRFTENAHLKIKKIRARIKDLNGHVVKELQDNEIIEAEIESESYVLKSDASHKLFTISSPIVPYILELEEEVDISSLMMLPSWIPESDFPVLNSQYILKNESRVNVRKRIKGNIPEPERTVNNEKETLKWEMHNLAAVKSVPGLEKDEYYQYRIDFFPDNITFINQSCDASSWESFGDWYIKLINDKLTLPDKERTRVAKLVETLKDKYTLIDSLYHIVQNETRYVALELGMRGWMPQSGIKSCELKYGDCKDLATLYLSYLKEASIESYIALARFRSSGNVYPEYPGNQFNHAIVCIPNDGDTLWVDCTHPFLGAKEIAEELQGTYALVIKPHQSRLVKLPLYEWNKNKISNLINFKIDKKGNLQVDYRVTLSGNFAQSYKNILIRKTDKEKKEWFLKDFLDLNNETILLLNYSVKNLNFRSDEDLVISISVLYPRFYRVTRKRLFVKIFDLAAILRNKITVQEDRRKPYTFYRPYQQTDTVIVSFTDRYKLESTPENVSFQTGMLSLNSVFTHSESDINLIREISIRKRRFEGDELKDLRKFGSLIHYIENGMIVLKKPAVFNYSSQ